MTRPKLRHLILLVVCLMYFIAYIDRVNVSVAAPMMRREWTLSPTQLGLVFAAFAYPYAGMQLVGGWLSDRFGPRRVLACLSALWAGATIASGLAWSAVSLAVCRALVGVGEGGAFPTATRAFSFWLPVRERGFAQGITHSFARLGGAVTPPVVLAIAAARGWRASFLALGAVSLAWTAVWLAVFRDTPAEHRWTTAAELAEIGGARSARGAGPHATPWKAIWSRMWLVTVVDFCYGWSLWVFLTWLPSYLSEARGFKLGEMAMMAALPMMAGVVGDTAGGLLSDAIYRRTGNLVLARRSVLVGGLAGALAFMLPAVTTASAVAAVYELALAFFCLELTNAVLWALPLDIAGEHAGTAGGMMNTGFGVAGMISPVVFGVLIERTGRYEVPFFISAALLAVGAVLALGIDPNATVRAEAAIPERRISV